MGFTPFYIIAVIPVLIGIWFWATDRRVVWWETGICAAVALAMAGTAHYTALNIAGYDTETWSGSAVRVTHYPRWVELQIHTHTHRDSNGHTHTSTEYRHVVHPEKWTLYSNINSEVDVDAYVYAFACTNFGAGEVIETPLKLGFESGDRNIYVAYNRSGYVMPVTDTHFWLNRIKSNATIFNFVRVSDEDSKRVFAYPQNSDPMISDRVMGLAKAAITTRAWDVMNARLGPRKGVNVIIVGFDSSDPTLGQLQEASWCGGKKNDVVICYGPDNQRPTWAYVFSWTKAEDLKIGLRELVLTNGVNPGLVPRIEAEVLATYQLRDWSEFDYISLNPPWWTYLCYMFLVAMVQIGIWTMATRNEHGKPWRRQCYR